MRATVCLAALVFAGCPGPDKSSEPSGGAAPAESTVRRTISASEGGEIAVGGALVRFPPGALNADTEIVVTSSAAPSGEGLLGWVAVGPDEVALQKPVTISLDWTGSIPEGHVGRVVSISKNNPVRSVPGSEVSYAAVVPITQRDDAAKRVTFEVDHFSMFGFFHESFAYLVLEIPGEYLKPGDLLFTLTGDAGALSDWDPGHVGLYAGAHTLAEVKAGTNDGNTTIEATSKGGDYSDGVQTATFSQFKSLTGHTYLGARRVEGGLTEAQRAKIMERAFHHVDQKTPYAMVGGASILGIDAYTSKLSCSGFVEQCYDLADASLIFGLAELAIFPVRQFNASVPVDRIEVPTSQSFGMKLRAVVREWELAPTKLNVAGFRKFSNGYTDTSVKLSASAVPDVFATGDARFEAELWTFDFTPKKEHIGKSVEFTFTLDASTYVGGVTAQYVEKLTIDVVEGDGPVPCGEGCTACIGEGETGPATRWVCGSLNEDHLTEWQGYTISSTGMGLCYSSADVYCCGRTKMHPRNMLCGHQWPHCYCCAGDTEKQADSVGCVGDAALDDDGNLPSAYECSENWHPCD